MKAVLHVPLLVASVVAASAAACDEASDLGFRLGGVGGGEASPSGHGGTGGSSRAEGAGTGGESSPGESGGSGGSAGESGGTETPLVDLGGGLVYDGVSDITWLGWGLTFSDDVKAHLSTSSATTYDGPLMGATVEASTGTHTLTADDFKYMETMGQRWFGSWYAARAWVASYSYPWGSHQTITGWRLPSLEEANRLWLTTGGAYCGTDGCSLSPGTVAPFTFILPKIWIGTELTYADFTKYTPADSSSVYSSYVATGFSNVWAVVDGRVTTQ